MISASAKLAYSDPTTACKGFALTYRKRRIPKPKELAKFGERWRPYRTVAN